MNELPKSKYAPDGRPIKKNTSFQKKNILIGALLLFIVLTFAFSSIFGYMYYSGNIIIFCVIMYVIFKLKSFDRDNSMFRIDNEDNKISEEFYENETDFDGERVDKLMQEVNKKE